jgi:hypothetical protein
VSDEWRALTKEQTARRLIDGGYQDDEILELVDHTGTMSLRQRREWEATIRTVRGQAADEGCSPKLRLVEHAYREAGIRPLQKQVAAKMDGVSERTVLRHIQEGGVRNWQAMHVHMAEKHPR